MTRQRKSICQHENCTKSAIPPTTFCVAHGGGKRCKHENCTKSAISSTTLCVEHGGGKRCKHENCTKLAQSPTTFCVAHGGGKRCQHENCTKSARPPTTLCAAHGGGNRCKHENCTKSAISPTTFCIAHGGGNRCKHGRQFQTCSSCSTNKGKFCKECKYTILSSPQRKELGICAGCDGYLKKEQRLEHYWLKKFESWGYHPSLHDEIVRNDKCEIVNKRRGDYIFITGQDIQYNVLCECDENSHSSYPIRCEYTRLQDVHDQICANQLSEDVPLLYVIRFNPNAVNQEMMENELKNTLQNAFKGIYEVNDDRGFAVHDDLFGYSEKRKEEYKLNPITKRIKICSKFNNK